VGQVMSDVREIISSLTEAHLLYEPLFRQGRDRKDVPTTV